ncbi:hypothetical protein PISMIDRAFT_16172 [Pisolithus microcarpus 441]|uniref:Aminotransferase class V domain-containing protein n=1 Tax=Pisolithus microcarpus 441 TaxID=765257 RepID=A0A0C9Z0V8_9AGAM|nr:hypothetical protein BKA83DRAFT_16172 [Pisolithus microcarpus]KIK15922.1 hypothetical protein PISMIDRAFT_16172 [Pisolithus microcarpus 441]
MDLQRARASFLSLRSGLVFADNAGGSQTCQQVLDRIVDYLSNTKLQLGADYSVGVQSSQRVTEGLEAAALLFNAASVDEVGFGPCSTIVLENIARAMDNDIQPVDKFIITEEHEGNSDLSSPSRTPRAIVKYWRTVPNSKDSPYSLSYSTDDPVSLVSAGTRLVTVTACSNVLGSIIPVEEVVRSLRRRAKELSHTYCHSPETIWTPCSMQSLRMSSGCYRSSPIKNNAIEGFIVIGQNAMKSKDVAGFFGRKGGNGIRYGHFYAYSVLANIQPRLDVDDGVARISIVHYNTVEEVKEILEVLKEAPDV